MTEQNESFDEIKMMADFLLAKQPHRPTIGIICGSDLDGLATGLADKLEKKCAMAFKDIPGFPLKTVAGSVGHLYFGNMNGKCVVVMQGSFNLYEGHPPLKTILPVRGMSLIGVKTLIVTNTGGGMNPDYKVGDIMLMIDHIGLPTMTGSNPLRGLNDERLGPRFPNMSNAYDKKLRELALKVAQDSQYSTFVKEGVFVMVEGPSYETQAELRFLRSSSGADVVGMTTVLEVIAARHHGLRVLGFSLVTRACNMDNATTGEEVVETGKSRVGVIQDLIGQVVDGINGEE
ncbi:purine nucleoside phosphorylase-like [Lytechinus variegatus]|uniref:purine nucleoside phosphorylase-like n=1 Tax=Lytechinus variegatus TaxID=7654 RepID=UPI001BB12CCF|nr:purine nucleoside phosphorylase-like [Lytechinus variegatus]